MSISIDDTLTATTTTHSTTSTKNGFVVNSFKNISSDKIGSASDSSSSSALQEDANFMNQQKLKLALEPVILTDLLMM